MRMVLLLIFAFACFYQSLAASDSPSVHRNPVESVSDNDLRRTEVDRRFSKISIDFSTSALYTSQQLVVPDMRAYYPEILPNNTLDRGPVFNPCNWLNNRLGTVGLALQFTKYPDKFLLVPRRFKNKFARNFGMAIGLAYGRTQGDFVLDSLHVEDSATDQHNRVYRQIVSAKKGITEKTVFESVGISVSVKYKHQKKRFGIFGEINGIVGVYDKSSFSTNTVFDYEAIYKRKDQLWVYDKTPTPWAGPNDDIILTKNYLESITKEGFNVQDYFESLHQGINKFEVGLNQSTTSSGAFENTKIRSIGGAAQVGMSYSLSLHTVVKLGITGSYQEYYYNYAHPFFISKFRNDYNSLLNGVSRRTVKNVGLSLSISFFIGRGDIDYDMDGIYDRFDDCPGQYGSKVFGGCPDSDRDGIPDKSDLCPDRFGPASSMGCPDLDGDCIPDKIDLCPDAVGVERLMGCPMKEKHLKNMLSSFYMKNFIPIKFDKGQTTLTEGDKSRLKNLLGGSAKSRKKMAIYIIAIEPTDGSSCVPFPYAGDDNLRAEAIKSYLVSFGKLAGIISGNYYTSTDSIMVSILFGEYLDNYSISKSSNYSDSLAQPRIGGDTGNSELHHDTLPNTKDVSTVRDTAKKAETPKQIVKNQRDTIGHQNKRNELGGSNGKGKSPLPTTVSTDTTINKPKSTNNENQRWRDTLRKTTPPIKGQDSTRHSHNSGQPSKDTIVRKSNDTTGTRGVDQESELSHTIENIVNPHVHPGKPQETDSLLKWEAGSTSNIPSNNVLSSPITESISLTLVVTVRNQTDSLLYTWHQTVTGKELASTDYKAIAKQLREHECPSFSIMPKTDKLKCQNGNSVSFRSEELIIELENILKY